MDGTSPAVKSEYSDPCRCLKIDQADRDLMKVLHVVESFGGGVVTALLSYVEATPELDHHLLRKERSDSLSMNKELERVFASVQVLPRSLAAARATVKRTVRSLNPAVVHAHSSVAGAIVRTAIRPKACSIVYTPHCYAFERKDVSNMARRVFWLVEKLLARNTTAIAACSPRELELAESLRSSQTVFHVPNASSPKDWPSRNRTRVPGEPPTVIGVGRLSTQKDPSFFADVIGLLRQEMPVRGVWIGGGNTEHLNRLVDEDIEVTGWLEEDEVFRALSAADVYLHCAQWEGMPLSLLEANALGLPIVARRVESMAWVPKDASAVDPEGIAEIIKWLVNDNQEGKKNRRDWELILNGNNLEEQRRSLLASYDYKKGDGTRN